MNKYRDKSDFEINKAVAEELGEQFTTNGKIIFVEADVPSGIVPYSVFFNPCNNPYDAMPIVIENKITVAYDKLYETWCAHVGSVMSGDGGWDYSIEPVINYCDDNYYRAAMICFLMMKDAENEK
ncbi:phage protein NinX family protein [Morganella morganii]|uniref:phage protein NinX family protein n=1 Tax=Morganella morganii TaxID=582 RepID=UPI0030FE1FFE